MNNKQFPDRQGCGVIQKDAQNILIFGGFSGRFLRDSYLFNVNNNQLTRTQQTPNETFVFQMPVAYNPADQAIYSCDFQHMVVFKCDHANDWSNHMSLKG